jgi:hypothetical protein
MGSTDPTGTKKKTMELVTMREQPAISERFESAGFESLNFIYNSSSFIQWLAIISLQPYVFKILNKVCTWCPRSKLSRKIGILLMKQ